jgi:hypothetical protein
MVSVALVATLAAPRAAHALVAALVQVTNTTANPVATEKALGGATLLEAFCSANSVGGFIVSDTCFTVPAGQRAVIENVDGNCLTQFGEIVNLLSINITATGVPGVTHAVHLNLEASPPNSSGVYAFNGPVRYYADSGANLHIETSTSNTTNGGAACRVQISGRLVPKP